MSEELEPNECFDYEVKSAFQNSNSATLRNFQAFLRQIKEKYKNDKGDEKTNIIDQGEKTPYGLPPEVITDLMKHLDLCRKEKITLHISEKQIDPSGIMLDFDMFLKDQKTPDLSPLYPILSNIIVSQLANDLDFFNELGKNEVKLHLAYIVKPEVVKKEDGKFKYGIHILIPSVKVSKIYKKYLISELQKNETIIDLMKNQIGCVYNKPREIQNERKEEKKEEQINIPLHRHQENLSNLDSNCYCVPVLFIGSCKKGSIPYEIGAIHEVIVRKPLGKMAIQPIVSPLKGEDLLKYNLVYEFSLNYEASPEKFVRKVEYRPKDEKLIRSIEERKEENVVHPENDLFLQEDSLSILMMSDYNSRFLKQILDLLHSEYYDEYDKWRDVVFAIANTSQLYKPLAMYFSQKSAKYNPGELEKLWEIGLRNKANREGGGITKKSLMYWAKQCEPVKYMEITQKNCFQMILKDVFEFEGSLEHEMVAKVLYLILAPKFKVDTEPGTTKAYWYEFMMDIDDIKQGEVWKWRKEDEPGNIHKFISGPFALIFKQIDEYLRNKRDNAESEQLAKYYTAMCKTFRKTRLRLGNDTFKNGIIKQAHYYFREEGFAESLDKDGRLLGVGNGVLVVGRESRLITKCHEFAISRFTPTNWRRFDPATNQWDRIVLGMINDIIPEVDVRLKLLLFIASSIDGRVKEGLMLIWEGSGRNGKSTLLRAIAHALGPLYATKFPISLFTEKREAGHQTNTALMSLKDKRFAYSEELEQSERANTSRIKEIVNPGEMSGNDKYKTQETFTIKCNTIIAMNFSLMIPTRDDATWRRLMFYTSKIKFMPDPNPANKFEKKDDSRFISEFPDNKDFAESILSLLVYLYEKLQIEFGGRVKHVVSPTMTNETLRYRNTQDTINQFISEHIVYSPESKLAEPISSVAEKYNDWLNKRGVKKLPAPEIIKDLESSAISKHLRPTENKTFVLHDCRITTEVIVAGPNERYINGVPEDVRIDAGAQIDDERWWMKKNN